MERPSPFALKKSDLPWVVVSLLVLVPCLYYPYITVTKTLDFSMNMEGKVLSALPCQPQQDCLKVNDRILAIGKVTYDMYVENRAIMILDEFGEDGIAPVRFLRDGREMTLMIRNQPKGHLRDISSGAFFPTAFWLMGTVAILFMRPKDERWLVLILFSYVTAVWFAAGFASSMREGYSSVVFHLVIWSFLPLSLHLHLLLPSSLLSTRQRQWLLGPLYVAMLVVTLLDTFFLLGPLSNLYLWTTLAAVLSSIGLLVLRLFLPSEPAAKVANRMMLYGILLGLIPFFLIFAIMPYWMIRLSILFEDFRQVGPWLLGLSVLSVPILPMSYLYAIYKHHVGELELRANRLLGLYSFAVLSVTSYVAALFVVSSLWAPIRGSYVISVLGISLLFIGLVSVLRKRFQALVDRHIFGIRHSPDEVIDLVSERIPTAFDRAALVRVLTEEILPSLLIRQSALHLLERTPDDGLETLYEQGVPPGDPLAAEELRALLGQSGRYRHPPRHAWSRFDWVRLVTPLTFQGETVGVWLLGRRDPDDHYPSAEIQLLTTVANQIATMVENIRLYERAQQEIAQRKAAEEEIRRSEDRFRTLFEATLEGIAIVRNGTVLEVNHALLAIFGYAPGELIGRELSDLVSVPETGLDDVPREGHGFQRDGSVVDIEVAGKKYVFQGEDVTVVAIRDIVQRKRNEAENKMLQRQLLLSQKMEAIGRLSAGVAHDFNNCLLAIFGYNDLMIDRYRSDPFLVRNLNGVKEAGQKAAALTKQLLAFARRQPMETRVLELNPVITGLEKMLQRLLGEDIHLVSELGSDLGRIKVDPGQIEQVVVNLAVNARHAMPTGGKVTIRTSAVRAAPGNPAPHADVPAGSWLLLSVADTGTGMDAETQARVFEPFFSTKGEGTGLGLSMAYGIVKQSGGHIFVDSSPGAGAVFSIYLPLTQEAGTVVVAAVSGLDDSGSETILLVEDEGEVRRVLHQILVGRGYRVIQAESGDEALAMARMFRGVIHLLLTDVTMPQMKGPELATRLVAERPQTRVLFMSGYNDESLSAEETILQKPFAAQTLTQTIRSILDAEESLPKSATA
jgi:two-component system, cell cycle sensor histidine kinase and response regulator CckA